MFEGKRKHALNLFMICILIPFVLVSSLFLLPSFEENYSVFLGMAEYKIYSFTIAQIILIWIVWFLHEDLGFTKDLVLYFVLAELCILIPYEKNHIITDNLHLLCAYGGFFVFQYVLCRRYRFDPHLLYAYLPFLFLSVLLVLKSSAVTGLAELVYGLGMDVLFCFIERKRKRAEALHL